MKLRHVFITPDLPTALAAMDAARGGGVDDADLLLVARSDIEEQAIPSEHRAADTDTKHAAVRGAGYGAGAGLLAGLATAAIPGLGVTLIGAAAATLAGAAVGTWSSALVGSAVPDPVRRKFHDEIEAGNILLVVDAPAAVLETAQPAIVSAGAKPLPFEATKAMS